MHLMPRTLSGQSSGPASLRRRGTMLIELSVAALFLAITMALVAQLASSLVLLHRDADRRELATQEVANLMERIAALPSAKLTAEDVSSLTKSESARRALPGAQLNVSVADSSPPSSLKRVAIELRWRGGAARNEAPVRLTAWLGPNRRANP